MNYNTVLIMRGVSGSGKDTWIKENVDNARVCSADNFFLKKCGFSVSDKAFMGPNGQMVEYVFDVGRLPEAHSWCMGEFLKAVYEHVPAIVVNNTHTRCWEWENYARIALIAGYDVEVVTLACTTLDQVRICRDRNVHDVPASVIAGAAVRFEDTSRCSEDLRSRIKSTVLQVT